jgi:peptidoglycan/xylan/chitin deacetylase (PgdA/CDA1 family)
MVRVEELEGDPEHQPPPYHLGARSAIREPRHDPEEDDEEDDPLHGGAPHPAPPRPRRIRANGTALAWSEGMTRFLLREDDVNATTDLERLERTYAPLLDAGVPLTFSVIPSVRFDTLAPDGQPERFLPLHLAGSPQESPLLRSCPAAAWLREHAAQCSVAQHGFNHQRVRNNTEFGALTRAEAAARIDAGYRILTRALGSPPLAFVAPWDAMSSEALEVAVERFPVVSPSWLGRERLPARWWPAHLVERVQKSEILRLEGRLVLRHRGGPIGPQTPPDEVPRILESLAHRAEIAVVMLHHWMFWERDEPHPVVRALARALEHHEVIRLEELVPSRPSRGDAAPVSSRDSEEAQA